MLKYLRLIRLPNLVIIILTQYLMRYSIIEPILHYYNLELQLPDYFFALIVISTVCLAAAGYVINDYFDRRIDLINRPGEVLVGSKINRRHAMILHSILNIIGVFIGFYLAYYVNIYLLALVYLIIAGLFWYYSTNYKRQFLVGNLIVALLTALVPIQIVLYENVVLYNIYGKDLYQVFKLVFWWVAAFGFFAFMTNLTREIIKDIEDFEGDNAFGRNSLPVVLGVKASKLIVTILSLITISAILYTYYFHIRDNITLIYLLVAIILPICVFIFLVYRANTKKQYHFASNFLKIIMLTGILYALVAEYIINQGV